MSRWTAADIPNLTGRVALVTGANAGLGLEIATQLARHGARVILACRNAEKGRTALATLLQGCPQADARVQALDLASLASVERCAAEVIAAEDRLDLLINNAGLMAIDAARTEDGFEMQLGVNHLGHFALTARLLPLLLATGSSRVASMSSMGHRGGKMVLDDLMFERRGYRRWGAYTASKLANLLFTAELHRRLTEAGASTIAVAAHPGGTRTDLGFEGSHLSNRVIRTVVPLAAQRASLGALPMLRAATAPDVRGGEFYGPRFLAVGYPVRERPSRAARDAEAARRLWELSSDLVDVHPVISSATA
jgi:NAD(P)-dependent dehydrogenase (short-subunit alcohol dehydrogenase family)